MELYTAAAGFPDRDQLPPGMWAPLAPAAKTL